MKKAALFLFVALFGTAVCAHGQTQSQSQPQPSTFMGHQLGETVSQWLSITGYGNRCSTWLVKHSAQNINFCKSIDQAALQNGETTITTADASQSGANDLWFFQSGTLAAVVVGWVPFDKNLGMLHDRYGSASKDKDTTMENTNGGTYVVHTVEWNMPDGAIVAIVQNKVKINLGKVEFTTPSFVAQEKAVSNPY